MPVSLGAAGRVDRNNPRACPGWVENIRRNAFRFLPLRVLNRPKCRILDKYEMRTLVKFLLAVIAASAIAACSLFDSGVEWRGGPYALLWIDTGENVSVVRQLDDGNSIGRIDATVFAVGWDGRYIVAKQHPGGIRSTTNYFIIDSQRDSQLADTAQAVIGPLTREAFDKKSAELKLPEFSKTLPSLE